MTICGLVENAISRKQSNSHLYFFISRQALKAVKRIKLIIGKQWGDTTVGGGKPLSTQPRDIWSLEEYSLIRISYPSYVR